MNQLPLQFIRQWTFFRHPGILPQFATKLRGVIGSAVRGSATFRQGEAGRVIQVPVLFWSTEWQMRFDKADGQEEGHTRLLLGQAEPANSFIRNAAVRVS